MLLNKFLHLRSLTINEQYQKRMGFNTLTPKTTIYDSIDNIKKEKEKDEEIRNIVVGGDDTSKDKLIENLEEEVTDLEEEVTDLEEEVTDLEEEVTDLEEDVDKLEEKKEKESEVEWEAVEEDPKIDIEDVKGFIKEHSKSGGDMIKHKHKDVIFDNLSKDGGNVDDEDVKNVVVSFF